MKSIITLAIAILVAGALLAPEAIAQRGPRWKGSGGWGPGSQYSRLFDPKTVVTTIGQVAAVERITPIQGMGYGIHLNLRTAAETLPVHLGPGWFIENQDIEIKPMDEVEIRGSRIMLDGKPVIIASQVRKGEDVLCLRDDNGFPLWAGWRISQAR